MFRFAIAATTAALLSSAALAEPVAYDFDKSHANLSFTYNHLGFSTTDGRFGSWEGDLKIDQETPANSSISFTIDIDSLDTFFADRDAHLKSADFFDAAQHPKATFISTNVKKTGDTSLEVTGDLTLKGITKPATLNVEVTQIGEHPMAKKPAVGFAVTTTLKRSDYGMDAYVPYVSDEVAVTFHAETLQVAVTN